MEHEIKYSWRDWAAFLLPAVVIGGWGCLVLYLYSQGQLGILQHPRFHGISVFSGGILVFLTLAYPFVKDPEQNQTIRELLKKIAKSIALLLPLFLIMAFPLSDVSPDWLMSQSSKLRQLPAPSQRSTPPDWLTIHGDLPTPTVLDVVAAAENPKWRSMMEGRHVKVLGQWIPREKDSFQLVRIFMYCCVADARPITLSVRGVAPGIASPGWVWVTGVVNTDPKTSLPSIRLEKSENAPVPEDIFLY